MPSVYLPDKEITLTFPDDSTPEEMQAAINRDYYPKPPAGFLKATTTGVRGALAGTAEGIYETTGKLLKLGGIPPRPETSKIAKEAIETLAPTQEDIESARKTLPGKAGLITGTVAGSLPEFLVAGKATAPLKAVRGIGRLLAPAAQFGVVEALHGGVEAIPKGLATGTLFGLANLPASRALKIILSAGLGGGLAKESGADPEEIAISTGLFGALAAIGSSPQKFVREASKTPEATTAEVVDRLRLTAPEGKKALPSPPERLGLPAPEGVAAGEGFTMEPVKPEVVRTPAAEVDIAKYMASRGPVNIGGLTFLKKKFLRPAEQVTEVDIAKYLAERGKVDVGKPTFARPSFLRPAGQATEAEIRDYLAKRGAVKPDSFKFKLEARANELEGGTTLSFLGTGIIKPGLQKIAQSKTAKHFQEFWQPFSSLPEGAGPKVEAERNRSLGQMDRVGGMVDQAYRDLQKFPEAERKIMFEAITNVAGDRPAALKALSPEATKAVRSISNLNDMIGKMLVRRGMISEDSYKNLKGQYVRYYYLRHLLPDDVPLPVSGSGRLNLSYAKARKDLSIEARRAIGLVEDLSVAQPIGMAQSLSDIIKYDLMESYSRIPGIVWRPSVALVKGIPQRFFTERSAKSWAASNLELIRDEYGSARGRIEKVAPNQFQLRMESGQIVGRKMSIGELADEAKKFSDMARFAPKSPEIKTQSDSLQTALKASQGRMSAAPTDYVQVPNTKNWGALRGAYLHKAIYNDLVPVQSLISRLPESLQQIARFHGQALGLFKVAKVALNPPTVARNIAANPILLNMSGIPLHKIPGLLVQAAQSARSGNKSFVEARRNGLFKTNFTVAELNEITDTFRSFERGGWGKFIGGVKGMAKFYGRIDDFFKLAKFIEQRQSGASVEKAAQEAQKWIMDYSVASPIVKVARQTVVPFASFTYKVAPLIAEAMAKRPMTVLKWALIPMATIELLKSSPEMTEDEWTRLQRELPLYIREHKTYAVIPWKDDKGQYRWVNMEYFFPWGSLHQAALDTYKGKGGEVVRDLGIGSNPFLQSLMMLSSARNTSPPKDPFTGMDIYNQLDSPKTKAIKTTEYLMNQWLPSSLAIGTQHAGGGVFGPGSAVGYTIDALAGNKDRYGREVTPEQAALRWVGVNVVTPNPQQTQRQIAGRATDLKKSLIRILTDPQEDSEKKAEAMRQFQKEMGELMMVEEQ